MDVTSSDDGVNAAGGSTATTATQDGAAGGMGGPGGGSMEVGDYSITVTGGDLTINAEGDGLDSNGNASITGGNVVVNGPISDGNGTLDVNGETDHRRRHPRRRRERRHGGNAVGVLEAVGRPSDLRIRRSRGHAHPDRRRRRQHRRLLYPPPAKDTASLVYSSADIAVGDTYTVHTGGTEGSTDGAQNAGTVTAGEYTQEHFGGPGF